MDVVKMTDQAVARIREMLVNAPGKVARLSTTKGGCASYKYLFDFADVAGAKDEVASRDGATVYVDHLSLMQVLGTTIDWQDDGIERKFVFLNPMETSRCGCGESFAV